MFLGGGVAVELGARAENREKISCLIVENTFTSIPDIARALFNFKLVRWLPNWFYKNQVSFLEHECMHLLTHFNFLQFKSRWKVCRISVPVLFVSGQADNLVPPKMMSELFNSCGSEVKRMAKFPGGTHNETWACQQYYATLKYFIEEVRREL